MENKELFVLIDSYSDVAVGIYSELDDVISDIWNDVKELKYSVDRNDIRDQLNKKDIMNNIVGLGFSPINGPSHELYRIYLTENININKSLIYGNF